MRRDIGNRNDNALKALGVYFRNSIDSEAAFNYTIALVFLRYLTEAFDATRASTDSHDAGSNRDRLVIPYGSSFAHLYEHRKDGNLANLVDLALYSFEEGNKKLLDGIFSSLVLNNQSALRIVSNSGQHLEAILDIVHDLEIHGTANPVDITLNEVIDRLAFDLQGREQVRTPPEIATLLVRLSGLRSASTILDPACGGGSILIEAAKQVGPGNIVAAGQEVNARNWIIARMKMIMNGLDTARIALGDSLRQPAFSGRGHLQKFDFVVSAPPFNAHDWGHEDAQEDTFKRFHRGVPPKANANWAYISHVIECLKPTGRAAIIVPRSALFRSAMEAKIRKAVINENILDAVIALPANVMPTSSTAVAILVFDKKRTSDPRRNSLCFINASKEYTRRRYGKRLSEAHIDRIVRTYDAYLYNGLSEPDDHYARVVPYDEVMWNAFSLHVETYMSVALRPPEARLITDEINRLGDELMEVRARGRRCFEDLGLSPGAAFANN